jgi:hypothetical protein
MRRRMRGAEKGSEEGIEKAEGYSRTILYLCYGRQKITMRRRKIIGED